MSDIRKEIVDQAIREHSRLIEKAAWKLKARGAKFNDIAVEHNTFNHGPSSGYTDVIDSKSGNYVRIHHPRFESKT